MYCLFKCAKFSVRFHVLYTSIENEDGVVIWQRWNHRVVGLFGQD